MDINKLQRKVLNVINKYPECANDDATLVAYFWLENGWNDNLSLLENMPRMTRGESITRRRRELHQMGLIEYSKQSDKERTEAFKNERDHASDYSPAMFVGLDM